MDYRHSHPINIFENTSKFFLLLLIPLIRGLLFSRSNFNSWLSGAWFDILILAGIIGLGFVIWYFNGYKIDENGIYIKKGILLKKVRFIPYRRLATISMEYPYYFMPVNAVRLYADTDAGTTKFSDFSITLRKKDALLLIEKSQRPFKQGNLLKRVYHPKDLHVAILSLITSNTLTGVLFFSTFVSQTGNILGKEFGDRLVSSLANLASLLQLKIPPAAAAIAYMTLGGWLISFTMTLIRHKGFTAVRKHDVLNITMGIIVRRRYSIATRRVNLVEVRQSLITKLFGLYSVFIHSSGYGKKKNELSVIIPAAEKFEARRNLKMLLPEIDIGKRHIRPNKNTFTRFIMPPINLILLILVAFSVSSFLFSSFNRVILFIGIMMELPAIWWLFVKISSYFHTGIGFKNGVYTLYHTYGFAFYITAVPEKRISKVEISQGLFQRISNCCNVIVYSYSEGVKKHVVNNISVNQAYEMFKF